MKTCSTNLLWASWGCSYFACLLQRLYVYAFLTFVVLIQIWGPDLSFETEGRNGTCIYATTNHGSLIPRQLINVVDDLVKLLHRMMSGRHLEVWHFHVVEGLGTRLQSWQGSYTLMVYLTWLLIYHRSPIHFGFILSLVPRLPRTRAWERG